MIEKGKNKNVTVFISSIFKFFGQVSDTVTRFLTLENLLEKFFKTPLPAQASFLEKFLVKLFFLFRISSSCLTTLTMFGLNELSLVTDHLVPFTSRY